jgi:Ca2+/H+ antiporter
LSVGLAVLLIAAYGLGMLFSLKTHRELFASAEHGEAGERRGRWVLAWPRWPASRCWWRW